MGRDQIERDLEQFADLAPAFCRRAPVETSEAVLLPVQMRHFLDGVRREFGSDVTIRWVRTIDVTRRYRIRRAARARKARRGWR